MCRSDISALERVWFSNILNSPFSFRSCAGPESALPSWTRHGARGPSCRLGTGTRHFGEGRNWRNVFFTLSSATCRGGREYGHVAEVLKRNQVDFRGNWKGYLRWFRFLLFGVKYFDFHGGKRVD